MSHAALLESVRVGLLAGLFGGALGWLFRGLRERRARAEHRRLLVSLVDEAWGAAGRVPAAAQGNSRCSETAETGIYVRPAASATEAETAVFCMSAEIEAQLGRER